MGLTSENGGIDIHSYPRSRKVFLYQVRLITYIEKVVLTNHLSSYMKVLDDNIIDI